MYIFKDPILPFLILLTANIHDGFSDLCLFSFMLNGSLAFKVPQEKNI